MRNRFLLSLSLSVFAPLYSLAQTLDRDTIRLEAVTVVSATKTEVSRNRIPATVSVVGREEIESSGESALLSVLTGRVPGLFVTERGMTGFGVSNGSAGTVNIRGVGAGNKVLMMLDGQPQYAGIFGHHLPDMYVSSDAEKVEVIRGPASLLYGSNAMGGVVNVISRRPDQNGFHGQGRIRYGSHNTQKYMANGGLKQDRLEVFLSANHDRTDGHRDNSEFHITNGFGKIAYRISPSWKVSGEAVAAKFKSHNPGSEANPMIDNWVDALRTTYSVSLENHYVKTSGAVKAFYNYGDHEVNDGWKNGEPREYLFRSRDHNAGVMFYQSVHLFSGNRITAGFDYKNWGGRAWQKYPDKTVEQVDKTVDETAVYLLAQQDLDQWTIHAGIRLEHNQAFGNEWIPQGGITYRLCPASTLKASVGKGFRSPNLRDLYMYAPANPDLKPESMVNYDVSWLQSFFGRRLNLELTLFYIDGKDMIQNIMVDDKPKNMNVGSFRNKGIETALDYRLSSSWTFSATYSYLHTSKPIDAAPRHLGYLEAAWKRGRWSANVSSQLVGKLYTDAAEGTREDFCLVHARAAYELNRYVRFSLYGRNLTDRKYSINEGFPMPGATVMGGVDFRF